MWHVLKLVCWSSFLLVYSLLLIDGYHGCQYNGPNNMCFYGDYFVFGNGSTHKKVMLVLEFAVATVLVVVYLLPPYSGCWAMDQSSLYVADQIFVRLVNSDTTQQGCRSWCLNLLWRGSLYCVADQLVPVQTSTTGVKYINFQMRRYIITDESADESADESFVLAKLSDVDPQKITCSELLSLAKGLTHSEYIERIEFVGPNRIEQV